MRFKKEIWIAAALGAAGLAIGAATVTRGIPGTPQDAPYTTTSGPASSPSAGSLDLKPEDVELFKIKPAEARDFAIRREAVGTIDFNLELSTDVFPPVPGKILKLFASAGDDVKEGAPLYTIDSPDLVQAATNLISAAGVLELNSRTLRRTRELYEVQGASQKDLDQAVSDQQAAEASLKGARDAVRIFGKTDQEMDAIVVQRKIDPALVVPAPISGRVTARNAAPGLLAQPGNQPAPFTISDLSTLWMLADVAENDFGLLRLGLEVDVHVKAYPGRVFTGKIANIGAAIDPSTRRVGVRSVVQDPRHELRPGMFATFVIKVGQVRSVAVPRRGVIREGDGTMSVWVTTDMRTIVRRTVKAGLEQDGFVQIQEGVTSGEQVATESALFLSNALSSTP
jgi:cobalt-zinc-cadmium efflux system membrane fusion protein